MQKVKIHGNYSVSLIIPAFNEGVILKGNIPFVIKAASNKNNMIKEIIIVDDASTDKSVLEIKKQYPEIKLIRHTRRRGLAASLNMGARSSAGKLLAFLDPEVRPQINFLEAVLSNFDNKDVFSVGLNEKGKPVVNGYFDKGFIVFQNIRPKSKLFPLFWVNRRGALYRRDYWIKLGGMDEALLSFGGFEDLDLTYRAAKRGLVNIWDPGGVIEVNKLQVEKKKYRFKIPGTYEHNKLLIHWKNLTSKTVIRKHLRGLIGVVLKNPFYIYIIFITLIKINPILRARKKELKESKIADEALLSRFKYE